MTDGSGHFLSYQLYENAALTQVWTFNSAGVGTGLNGSTDTVTPAGNAVNMTLAVYGDIPAGQAPAYCSGGASCYTDSVMVTVNY